MSGPTILEMQDELVERLKSTTTFQSKGFAIYDLRDLQGQAEAGVHYPMAGVAYEGGELLRAEQDTNKLARGRSAANTFNIRFSVIIGIDYTSAATTDRKDVALTLLQEVRDAVLGFRGVNSRPWMLSSEAPLDGDLDGVIFYGQLWVTDVITYGTHVEI